MFEDVSIVDAVNGLRTGQSVVVKGNRIIQTGPVDEIRKPSGANVVDCAGKYMIPGLWDAHVHITNSEAGMPERLSLFIVNGITYIRDTAAELDLILPMRQKAIEASMSEGMAPQIFMTGPHMDGLQLSWSSSVSAVSVEQARFIADCLINAGVDELKVYDLLAPEVAMEVFSIAREKGYRVCAHVPLGMDVVEASNAGLSSMEHMYNLEMACSADWDSLLRARQQMIAAGTGKSGRELREGIYSLQRMHSFQTQDEERLKTVLKTLAENNTWQVPTLVITCSDEHRILAREDYMETFRYMPEPIRTQWKERAARRAEQSPPEEGLAYASWAYDMVSRLAEAGVGIMAGTDMPLSLLVPGFSLHEELVLLVNAGLTPMQALEAATLRPAQYYRLEDQQGAISEGMAADLVILDANPLEDITNTQRIRAVMRDGHFHTRDNLDEILAQLEKSVNTVPE